jgi:toxin ParE1/3/4
LAFQPKKCSLGFGNANHEAVVFHPAARDEVEEAVDFYEIQRDDLGQDFHVEFKAALKRVVENPKLFAVEIGEFRACMLKRFPYTIFFIDLEDQIWVGAVAHQKRRPGYWAKRRPD